VAAELLGDRLDLAGRHALHVHLGQRRQPQPGPDPASPSQASSRPAPPARHARPPRPAASEAA
jgi:hypothetical protein